MPNILIYNDEGTGPRSLQQLVKALRKQTKQSLKLIDRQDLTETSWEETTHCLIFPGGRDIPYHEALKGSTNKRIRCYVENGGKYFGICAGAYYGCAGFVFEKGSLQEIIAERELKFYPGMAVGPAYGNGYYYQDERAARIALLTIADTQSASYYNGGCYFPDSEQHPSIKVIARYRDLPETPSAIVECDVGKGTALLCGVHPEYSAVTLKSSQDPYLQRLLPQLHAIEEDRKDLFINLLNRLSIS